MSKKLRPQNLRESGNPEFVLALKTKKCAGTPGVRRVANPTQLNMNWMIKYSPNQDNSAHYPDINEQDCYHNPNTGISSG